MKKLCFIGGDMRQVRVINNMSEIFPYIKIYGFDKMDETEFNENVRQCKEISEAVSGSDGVIFPLPYTVNKETVNAPFSEAPVRAGEVLQCMNKNQILLAGKADDVLKSAAGIYEIPLIDYLEREELAVLNAIPTAEGAIEIAMRETPYTLNLSRCLILGNGRIGKILAKMLDGIGAETTVCVRKYKDMAYCRAMGYKSIYFSNLTEKIENYDVVFNTVPFPVVGYKELVNLKNDSLIVDLASKPGGVDFETAKQLRKKTVHALSLPGKVAPKTAGDFISETLLNIIEELGV